MLEAIKGADCKITRYEKKNDGIYLYSEKGIFVFGAVSDNTVHLRYAETPEALSGKDERNEFVTAPDLNPEGVMDIRDGIRECVIVLNDLKIKIYKDSGSITFADAAGRILLRQAQNAPVEMESYGVYDYDESTMKIDEIQTPDGTKKRIIPGEKVYSRDVYRCMFPFVFDDDEDIYGLGQFEHGPGSLRGERLHLHQANRQIVIPYIISTKGYGMLINMHSPMIFNDGKDGAYFYAEATKCFDIYFVNAGSISKAQEAYRSLTGKATMLPKWAFGYMQSQERYETQEEILSVASEYRKRGLGLDTIILDWCSWPDGQWGQKTFDETRFPDPKGMTDTLHDEHTHFMISIWPNFAKECPDYMELYEGGMILKASETYDAFNPKARTVYWRQTNESLFKYGVDGWWCDNSEPFDPSWTMHVRPEAAALYYEYVEETSKHMDIEYANTFGYFHVKGVYDGQRATCKASSIDPSLPAVGDKRVTNLTRSAYLGSQRFGTIMWSGDIDAKWDVLKKQIAAGLNFSAAGMPYWTLDIGAFFVKEGDYWYWKGEYEDGFADEKYRELFVRWYWYGAFLPIFRGHGTDFRRELWLCENGRLPYYDALVTANRLRYELFYYIYSAAGMCYLKDKCMMNPLVIEFPDDLMVRNIFDQYMFGTEIMVCPVYEPMKDGDTETVRRVYLPKQTAWYDYFTKERYEGGQYIFVRCPIDKIPVLVRDGAVIPKATWKGDVISTETLSKDYYLDTYGDGSREFVLYDDAGDGYGYEKGEYTLTTLKV